MTTAGFLNLDYSSLISQWGEGSVFACDSGDALGDLLLHLEDDDDDCDPSSFLDCIEESTTSGSHAAPAAANRSGTLDLPQCAAPCFISAASHLPAPPSHTFQQTNRPSGNAPLLPQQWHPKMQFEPAPQAAGWWDCTPGFPGMAMRDDAKPVFPISAFAMQMQHSIGRPIACEPPCIVPDSSAPAAPAPVQQFGLVPQLAATFHCAPPLPPPAPMLAAPQLSQHSDHTSDVMKLRQECLKRYRDKKARRMYTKLVRYQLRKINADKRPRIKGRFVKKTQEELAAAAGASAMEAPAASPDGSDSLNVDDGMMSDVSS